MALLQHILVYITVALAVGYLVYKFFIPKMAQRTKTKNTPKACGQDKCGCH